MEIHQYLTGFFLFYVVKMHSNDGFRRNISSFKTIWRPDFFGSTGIDYWECPNPAVIDPLTPLVLTSTPRD